MAALVIAAAVAASCTSDGEDVSDTGSAGPADTLAPVGTAAAAVPSEPVTAVAGQAPAQLALNTSRLLHEQAPVVVLAAEGDLPGQAVAAAAATARRAPLLLVPQAPPAADVAVELERLGTEALLAVGAASLPVAESFEGDLMLSSFSLPDGRAAFGATSDPTGDEGPAPSTGYDALSQIVGSALGAARAEDPELVTAAVAAMTASAPGIPVVRAQVPVPATATEASAGASAPRSVPRARPDGPALPQVDVGGRADGTVVLASADPAWVAAVATARASGADVIVLDDPDPRASSEAIAAISADDAPVVALGDVFGDPELLTRRVEVVRTGVELPGGGQVLFPDRRFVALYGTPSTDALGSLGEQGVEQAITRAQQLAAEYQPHSPETVVPAFEIISTVASGVPGEDGDYSYDIPIEEIRPWVDAAGEAGVYVVLDLQPGRSDFLGQAQRYEELLLEPHVGLALDAEWRLKPDQVHLRQVGTVTAAEINQVGDWLAQVTADNDLPQKLLLLHQFKLSMISERDMLDLSHDELAVMIHADGFGTPGQKLDTWGALRRDAPPVWWGWKNFIDEDDPMLTGEETMAIEPRPWFVSFQ